MNPAIFCDTDVQTKIIPEVMKDVVGIVLGAHKKITNMPSYNYKSRGWEVVVDEEAKIECSDV